MPATIANHGSQKSAGGEGGGWRELYRKTGRTLGFSTIYLSSFRSTFYGWLSDRGLVLQERVDKLREGWLRRGMGG